jgi:glycosyltransferase involved in cell wall biosynthesis
MAIFMSTDLNVNSQAHSLVDQQMPLVSVIIPTYNRPKYLREAIASVLRQTYTNFEIIVSDDGSAESPEAIVTSFQDARIRFRRNATNLGIGWNATYAFQAANGSYVASLNDDDMWNEDFLEKLVPPLQANPDLALAFCDYSVMDAEGNLDPQRSDAQSRQEKRDRLTQGIYQPFWQIGLVDQSVFTACAALIRKDAVDWDRLHEGQVFWDFYLTYLACRSGGGAYYCPERLARYRVHPQSENMLSGSRNAQAKIRKGKAGMACFEQFMAEAPTPALRAYFRQEWAHFSTTLAIGLLRSQQVIEARPYLWRSLQQQPLNLRTLTALALSYVPPNWAHSLAHLRNPGLSRVR